MTSINHLTKKKAKVFLVDNDEDKLLFMKKGFESTGLFNVIATASDGEELFELLNNSKTSVPDLIYFRFKYAG